MHLAPSSLRSLLLSACVAACCCAGDAPAGRAAAPSDGPSAGSYRLFPGDLVDIRVFDHPDVSMVIRVPPNGPVDFPLIGAVDHLAGRELEALTTEIAGRLQHGYLRHAVVTATVTAYARRQAFVLGAVGHASSVDLDPLAPMTAMQAISAAGGFSDDADRGGVQLLRESSGAKATPLPADERTGTIKQDVELQPGDVVVVPRQDRVFVLGQVNNPGGVASRGDQPLTLSRALTLAGGFARFAKQSSVQVMRRGGSARTVDARDVLNGKSVDPPLEPGDTVYVPESRF